MKHLTLPNDIGTVPLLSEFIDNFCQEEDIDAALTMKLNLAVEEAVVNVMSYGYPDNKVGLVDIDMESDGKWITITITDSGIPFDPTKKEEVDITLPADQRPIGGLGIYLVRNIMDTVEYQNINNQNILILRKELNKE